MDREEKKKCLETAFALAAYQRQLLKWRNELEQKLGEFITWLKTQLNEDQKIIESMEMRIKSKNSFNEKLDRKDYVNRLPDGNDMKEWQHIISTQLPDIIGFRINCYFYKDESVIYNKLKEYYKTIGWRDIKLNFGTNTKQANGHTIYKVEGTYLKKVKGQYVNTVKFELQIKSMIHNIWGEVDHRTIYKQRDYDINLRSREDVTEQIFQILKASDMQLVTLYNQKYTEQRAIEALFYKQTAEEIAKFANTTVLAKHYEHFFGIFFAQGREGLSEQIRVYMADKLTGRTHKNHQYRRCQNERDALIMKCKDLLKERYIDYDIDVLRKIASLVIYFKSIDDFRYFLSQELVGLYLPFVEQDYEKDAFSEEEDSQEAAWKDFVKKLDTIFKKRG